MNLGTFRQFSYFEVLLSLTTKIMKQKKIPTFFQGTPKSESFTSKEGSNHILLSQKMSNFVILSSKHFDFHLCHVRKVSVVNVSVANVTCVRVCFFLRSSFSQSKYTQWHSYKWWTMQICGHLLPQSVSISKCMMMIILLLSLLSLLLLNVFIWFYDENFLSSIFRMGLTKYFISSFPVWVCVCEGESVFYNRYPQTYIHQKRT